MKKATLTQTKVHNTRLILKTLYAQEIMSRADLARTTGLTRPTVSNIVENLLEDKLVIETGLGPSAGGKPPTLLSINTNAFYLVSIDLGSEEFRGALVNLQGEIVHYLAIPSAGLYQQKALRRVYSLIDSLIAASSLPIKGIAIGTPGLVNPHEGIVIRAVNLDWEHLPVRDYLTERYQLPVWVMNDSHAASLAECTFGSAKDSENLIVIKIGQGVGAGIVIHGQPFYGDGFGAGEIGHAAIAGNKNPCSCGNKGCLETLVGTQAILRRARLMARENPGSKLGAPSEVTWQSLICALEAGDQVAVAVVASTGRYLGMAMANLIASLNIHKFVIAGRISQFGDPLLEAIRSEALDWALPDMVDQTKIVFSKFEIYNVILGCATVLLKNEVGLV